MSWEDKKVEKSIKTKPDRNVKEIIITSTDSEEPIVFQPKHGISITIHRGMTSQPSNIIGLNEKVPNGTEITLILEAPVELREYLVTEFNKIVESVINT